MQLNKIYIGTSKLDNKSYGYSSSKHEKFNYYNYLDGIYDLGIRKLDTSPRYNNSEELIGKFIRNSNKSFEVSSKIDALNKSNINKIPNYISNSLRLLNVNNLEICYLHQNDLSIISNPYIHEQLLIIKQKKLVNKLGVSVYTHKEFEFALNSKVFDCIQFPLNIFDTSFYENFIKENNSNKKFIARSLLLQGIAGNYNDLENHIFKENINDYLKKIKYFSSKLELTIPQLSFAFLKSFSEISEFILGSLSLVNINNNIKSFDLKIPIEIIEELYELSKSKKSWSNPKKW
ncbi:aldo/keto reductase [Flavobacteriaceae bacterium]|nr:aldo/keto reductase [Flavobacteriaceae bacterium]